MYPVPLHIQYHEYREAKTLREAKFGQYFFVPVLFAVINVYHFVVGTQVAIQVIVVGNEAIEGAAPYAPVTANLYENVLVFLCRFGYSFIYLMLCIGFGVV
jgi:hypothetical protein